MDIYLEHIFETCDTKLLIHLVRCLQGKKLMQFTNKNAFVSFISMDNDILKVRNYHIMAGIFLLAVS